MHHSLRRGCMGREPTQSRLLQLATASQAAPQGDREAPPADAPACLECLPHASTKRCRLDACAGTPAGRLGEIAFCAVAQTLQVTGYGTRLMNWTKVGGWVARDGESTDAAAFSEAPGFARAPVVRAGSCAASARTGEQPAGRQ
mgnify:CR=1 FL=1